MESPYAMRHSMLVRYRTIPDDAVLKTGSRGSRSWVRIPRQSVHFVYILEKAETPHEMQRSLGPQRTAESRLAEPECLTTGSVRHSRKPYLS
jgi:hypothetical protein